MFHYKSYRKLTEFDKFGEILFFLSFPIEEQHDILFKVKYVHPDNPVNEWSFLILITMARLIYPHYNRNFFLGGGEGFTVFYCDTTLDVH
jgi:hypothetical protein